MGVSYSLLLKKLRSTTMRSESLHDVQLPLELIAEILVRLPVKSLLKFKCVSKSWLCLISSPQFVRSQISTSSETDLCLNSQVLFSVFDPFPSMKLVSLYSALYESSANVSDIEYPSLKLILPPLIVGIVNGLVCLFGDDGFFIWNPVLRKSKHFRSPDFSLRDSSCVALGFGYDDSKDDYKVVFVKSVVLFSSEDDTEVMVYSLRTDSWKRIEEFNHVIPIVSLGKYVNGKIHWASGSLDRKWKIMSLDMVDEKYGELQRPVFETGMSGWALGVLNGQLSVLCDYERRKADLWVMDKYGVRESWSKVVSIPYDSTQLDASISLRYVVCVLSDGEVVLSPGSDLLVYYPEYKEFRHVELGDLRYSCFHVYVESLVSPNGSEISNVA